MDLPNLSPSGVTVSGYSSGAFMSTYLMNAYPSIIDGAALYAGGLYENKSVFTYISQR